jgi:hypothetical protein
MAFLSALVGCGSDGATKPPPAAAADPVRLDATAYGPGEGAGFLRILPEGDPLLEWSPVYPGKPLALDIELKITHDNRLLIKQARPYLSELPPF